MSMRDNPVEGRADFQVKQEVNYHRQKGKIRSDKLKIKSGYQS